MARRELTEVPVTRFGETAWLVDVERSSPEADAARARQIGRALQLSFPAAEVIVGGAAVLLDGVLSATRRSIQEAASLAVDDRARRLPGTEHVIEVVYDGPDLDSVATSSGLSRSDVISRHTGGFYTVEVTGFLPGFGYLAELEPRLRLPRRPSPRKVVPAGSVGIAGRFTGIYPFASPGGWHLLGRAIDPRLFDPGREPPTRFAPGDEVRFVASDPSVPARAPPRSEGPNSIDRTPSEPAHLEILVCPPHATIQDLGRRLASRGIPRSGPLDVEAHSAANRAVGNSEQEATLELPIDRFEARVLRDVVVSVDGAAAEHLRSGELLRIDRHERAVRYLAVRGGIEVPIVLGARATLLVAGLGGLDGRRLRRGDRLSVGEEAGIGRGRTLNTDASSADPRLCGEGLDLDGTATARIIPIVKGPHLDHFAANALEVLCAAERTVSTMSDRVGVRLEGPAVPREGVDDGVPEPMRPGAVQIATDGTPIVLGPDSAVTGGYPVLAVVTETGRARLARVRPGGRVRFSVRD